MYGWICTRAGQLMDNQSIFTSDEQKAKREEEEQASS
jgi:hypothetical protein